MQTLGKNELKSVFSANYIAQMLTIIYKKKYAGKKRNFFNAPDKSANHKVNFDVISNFMTF